MSSATHKTKLSRTRWRDSSEKATIKLPTRIAHHTSATLQYIMRVLDTTLFALAATAATTHARRTPSDAVLLSNIKTLTLHGSRETTSRRGPSVPQLDCVGGNAKGLHDVDVMRCTNAGSDYAPEDVQWTCQATLPSEFKLGSTEVVCEGYESSEDPYVLKGSCGVEYRLVLTEAGEAKYGERYDYGQKEYVGGQTKGGLGEKVFTFVFWAIFLGECHLLVANLELTKLTIFSTGIVGLIVRSVWTNGAGGNAGGRRPGGGGGGGWGGGYGGDDDGHDDPPPPYTQSPPRSKPNSQSAPGSSAWRPGFFTGAATGAAAGYAMGNRNNRGPTTGQAGPSNWFGNGGGTQPGPSRSFGGGGGSSGSQLSSGSRHESTGFGGSRRR